MNSFTPNKQKEEEIRKRQAERNLNNFIYQTNQKLQNLNQSLIALSLSLEKAKAKFDSDQKELEIIVEKIKEKVESESDSNGHLIADYATTILNLSTALDKKFNFFNTHFASLEGLNSLAEVTEKNIQEIEKKQEDQRNYIESSLLLLEGQIDEHTSILRKELTPKGDQSDVIKKHLDERLNPFQIDFKGLIEEIAILKKAVKYSEKKFENIYTLIDRMKESKT